MAAGGPASAVLQMQRVVLLADENMAGGNYRAGALTHVLRMAAEAEIAVTNDEQLRIDGAVGIVAGNAAFAQRGMLENERMRLRAVALGTAFVQARHRQAAGGFHNVHAVGIVALDAVHLAFDDRVMLREIEFSVRFEMALETRGGVRAGIDDELAAPAARRDMQAARPVAGFATLLPGHSGLFEMQARVGTRREGAADV